MTGKAIQTGSDLLSNPVFLSAVSSMILAQFIKTIVNLLRYKERSLRETILTFLWRTGGMPSSHSAMVVSIATSIGIVEGPDSNLFILSFFFALVVIRDALGVRRSSGQQARALNLLSRKYAARFGESHVPVKEVLGHSTSQVLVGSVLGLFIAVAFCTL